MNYPAVTQDASLGVECKGHNPNLHSPKGRYEDSFRKRAGDSQLLTWAHRASQGEAGSTWCLPSDPRARGFKLGYMMLPPMALGEASGSERYTRDHG